MSHQPGSAEELYEFVCALQKEQHLTQVELRAVQRRTETLRQELHSQQLLETEEQTKQQEIVKKLVGSRSERWLAEAQARGAARASADAAQRLCLNRRAFVQKCHDYVLSVGKGRSDARLSDELRAPNNGTVLSCAGGELGVDLSSTPTAVTCRSASLMPAADVHRLLLLLRAKLERSLEMSTTALSVPLLAPSPVVSMTEEGSREQRRDRHPSTEHGLTRAVTATPMSPDAAGASLQRPSSTSLTEVGVCGTVKEMGSPRERKHIGFAPDSCFERVTAVSAANANRGTRETRPPETRADCPSSANPRNRRPPDTQWCRSNFTVRLASRSSTLVAEAAALGAKRQRASEAAKSTQSSPTEAGREDADKGASISPAPQCTSVAAPSVSVCPSDRSRFLAPVDLVPPRFVKAPTRNDRNGSSRRTVWRWTTRAPNEEYGATL
ncbi:hypothetical protein JKF63_02592 [Porcisia hertigi]|uniref:Uncharacterized protein n=1 Tax=Porcisia hertigi TaxID=2761500 RepID=A0A836HND5_9TRYP|nr:hypothetical protein JKF63_02592 [Porcisia hertigi]